MATALAGDLAAEAAEMAAAVGAAAVTATTATAAAVTGAGRTLPAELPPPPAPSTAAGATEPSTDALRASLASGLDEAVRTEFAVFLADPVMATFSADLGPDTVVSFASPAEQGLWRDISLARRVEAALQARQRHFEAAFDAAPTALLIVSLEAGRPMRVVHGNTALSELTGYPTAELTDLRYPDLLHPDLPHPDLPHPDVLHPDVLHPVLPHPDEPAPVQPVAAADRDGVQRWLRPDGSDMWVSVRTAPLGYSDDGVELAVCHIEEAAAPERTSPDVPATTAPAAASGIRHHW